MNCKWLLETDKFHENLSRLADEIRTQGMDCVIASYVPWADKDHPSGPSHFSQLFPENDCVVFYGTLNFGSKILRETKWIPCAYCNLPELQCVNYYPALGTFLLNDDYVMLPFGDLIRKKDHLYEMLGDADCLFIRPNSGMKPFGGQVLERERFELDVGRLKNAMFPHELCVVSSPKNVEDEWRFVVVQGKIVASSKYISAGEVISSTDVPNEAKDLAEAVVRTGFSPDSAWTLDICRTRRNEYRLLEVNCFSCAGLYACDLKPIVTAVSKAAIEDWKEHHGAIDLVKVY